MDGAGMQADVGNIHVLIAPDKFKGSLTAAQVARALAGGMRHRCPGLELTELPVADGGDGTVDAAVAAGYQRIALAVTGPIGDPVETSYARRGGEAVIELADACGISRLPAGVSAPMTAGTRGLGEVLAAALDAGCTRIVLGVGGSAGTDGGAGMVIALGARPLTAGGDLVRDGGVGLSEIARLDLAGLHPGIRAAEIRLACDVDNPLTGGLGAAAVYGPQKGSTSDEVVLLDEALSRWADVVASTIGSDFRMTPGAGASGGVGFAAMSLLGAVPTPGITTMLEITGFAERLTNADLVITGEGSLDVQTLSGKAPAGVARAAARAGIPTVAVCGRNLLTDSGWKSAGFRAVYALSELQPDPSRSIRDAAALLRTVGERIADELPGLYERRPPAP